MNTLIEFKPNGFIYEDVFYVYQSIASINSIATLDEEDVHFKIIEYGDPLENAKASKRIYFKVYFKNDKHICIGYVYEIDFYEKIPRKNKLMKFLFGDFKYIVNRQLNQFYSTKDKEMMSDLEELKQVRNNLIENFNNWKEK